MLVQQPIASVDLGKLLPRNLCFIPNDIFKQVKCRQHQCGTGICSTDEYKCKQFNDWIRLLDRHKPVDFARNTLLLFEQFVKSVRNCSSNQLVRLETEVCLNRRICYARKKWTSRLMFEGVDIVEVTRCACRGKYSVDCVNDYCARDTATCKRMFSREMNDTNFFKKIQLCK